MQVREDDDTVSSLCFLFMTYFFRREILDYCTNDIAMRLLAEWTEMKKQGKDTLELKKEEESVDELKREIEAQAKQMGMSLCSLVGHLKPDTPPFSSAQRSLLSVKRMKRKKCDSAWQRKSSACRRKQTIM